MTNWLFDVVESTASLDGPVRMGSRIRWVVKFMGRFEPGRLMEFKVQSGAPMRLRPTVTYQLDRSTGAPSSPAKWRYRPKERPESLNH